MVEELTMSVFQHIEGLCHEGAVVRTLPQTHTFTYFIGMPCSQIFLLYLHHASHKGGGGLYLSRPHLSILFTFILAFDVYCYLFRSLERGLPPTRWIKVGPRSLLFIGAA